MTACPLCATDLPDDHPAITADKLDRVIDWPSMVGDWTYKIGQAKTVDGLTFKVVKKELDTGFDSYGTRQEGVVFVVLEVDGKYFRKDGIGDSYADIEWNGHFRQVQPSPRTETVYDFL